jgi:hypothetical protein
MIAQLFYYCNVHGAAAVLASAVSKGDIKGGEKRDVANWID